LLEIPRSTLRQFRSLLRKSVLANEPRGPWPLVTCRAGRQGLTLFVQQGDVALRHHTPGSFRSENLAWPGALLPDLEAGSGVVTLEQTAPFKGKASWQDRSGPRVLEFETADPTSLPPTPTPAGNAVAMPPEFLQALDDAARTASRDARRYACNHVLLRGRDSSVIATDGRQLLIQRGFPLPWAEDRLVPALPAFGRCELPKDQPVLLGLREDWISLEVGPWLFVLRSDKDVRYPDVDAVIPSPGGGFTRLQYDDQDTRELIHALPRLPAHDDHQQPVTLELGSKIVVRARDGEGPIEEVCLSRSRFEGPALTLVTDRRHLLRALQLGFAEVLIESAEQPLLCKDARRTYLWMPLTVADAVPPGKRPRRPITLPQPSPGNTAMPVNDPGATEPRNGAAEQRDLLDPIAEAEALRVVMQEALGRTSRLLAALKQHRRQSRAVQAAVESLRRLKGFTG
jgi:hypothetical protein